VVYGYDLRAEVKEQIESLGGRFLQLDLEAQDGSATGGYAKAMSDEFYARQRQLLGDALRDFDLVVTTAAVPGRKAPILVTTEMAEKMAPGSVIVDLAAERGGNCELTRAGETIEHKGIKVIGPVQLPARLASHASILFSKNVQNFLLNMVKDGELNLNRDDPIVVGSLLAEGGAIVHRQVLEKIGAAQ
jgi:NAD(P) transhydrogenase subunit alpha